MIRVLIPAYDEGASLDDVLERIPRSVAGHTIRILVVSDGSTDETVAVARRHRCDTVALPHNRGKGAALRRGFAEVRDESHAALVLMDADGQHDPDRIVDLSAPVLDGSADMVVGSRYLSATGRGCTPWNRYAVRCVTCAVLRRVLGITVTDPFSGFRVLSPGAEAVAIFEGDRYESELELLFATTAAGLRVVEAPITRIYTGSTSKMGAQHGRLGGRISVVSGYARTIIRQVSVSHVEGVAP
jgi:glycosyltransferase involved in cell wall biosynthesis